MSESLPPYISCIIATHNSEKTIPIVLSSLAAQSCRDFEIIIQDGASADATLEEVERWQNSLPSMQVFSMSDKGIYDAWNKAVPYARGEWIVFLGDDDAFLNEASLQQVIDRLRLVPKASFYFASAVQMVDDASWPIEAQAQNIFYPSVSVEKDLAHGMALPHQGLFHRRSLFASYSYSLVYGIAGDYEFLARTYALAPIIICKDVFVCMGKGGVSSSYASMWRCSFEQLRISRKLFPKALPWKLYARCARNALFACSMKMLGADFTQKMHMLLQKVCKRK